MMTRRRQRWTNQRGRELRDGWERYPAVDPCPAGLRREYHAGQVVGKHQIPDGASSDIRWARGQTYRIVVRETSRDSLGYRKRRAHAGITVGSVCVGKLVKLARVFGE